jgi:hypothetical protein
MSEWTWEYVPDTATVTDGLTRTQINEVEALAVRIADAVAVRRIGTPSTSAELCPASRAMARARS